MIRRAPLQPPPYSTDRDVLAREVEMDVFRASGPGGQHVNRTESALRLTHPPSGVVVVAQDSPSQHRNREIAFDRLIERLRAPQSRSEETRGHQTHVRVEEAPHRSEEGTRRGEAQPRARLAR